MSRLIILLATAQEAYHLTKELEATCVCPKKTEYDFSSGKIVITGMGSLQALSKTLQVASSEDYLLNAGVAGALNSHLEVEKAYLIESVGKYQPSKELIGNKALSFGERLFPNVNTKDKGFRLITSDFPFYQEALKKQCYDHWDLVDMEGYAIAYGASLLKTSLSMLKVVSDLADSNTKKAIMQNFDRLSKIVAQEVKSWMKDNGY